jgi:hypothetical protein
LLPGDRITLSDFNIEQRCFNIYCAGDTANPNHNTIIRLGYGLEQGLIIPDVSSSVSFISINNVFQYALSHDLSPNLERIEFHNTTTIGHGVIFNLHNLTTVTFDKNVRLIGNASI